MNNRTIDQRKRGFFIIDNDIVDSFKLTPHELAVYIVIVRHANRDTGFCFPSYDTLAEKGGMSRPTAINSVKRLEELGLVYVERSKPQKDGETVKSEANRYHLIDVEEALRFSRQSGGGGKGDLPVGVNDVDSGGKAGLPLGVNDVDSNKIDSNKTQLTTTTKRDGAPSAGATVAPRAASVQDGSSGGQPSRPLPNHVLANMPAAVAVKDEQPSKSGAKPDITGRPFVQFCMKEWGMTGRTLSDKLYKGFTEEAYEYYEGHRIPKGDLMSNWEHTPGFENFARARFEMFRAKANREKAGNSWASDYLANLKKFSVEKVDGKGWPGFNQWKRENPSQAKQISGKNEPVKIVYVEAPDEEPLPWEVE